MKSIHILMAFITLLFCQSIKVISQVSSGGLPLSFKIDENINSGKLIPIITLPDLDINKILEESVARNDTAFLIGQFIKVDIDLQRDGLLTALQNGDKIYRLKIIIKNAKAIELSFDNFYLPEGTSFYVYNQEKSSIAGAFTNRNNRDDRKFSIQPVIDDNIILEYYEPSTSNYTPSIHLDYVSHIFVDLQESLFGSLSYVDCFLDVHCAPWIQNLIRSVVRWTYRDTQNGLNYVCSGVLIGQDVDENNSKYYVLTANHCGKNADLPIAKFYFNYQNPDCDVSGGTLRYSTVGATKLAKRFLYDMFLVELDEEPHPDYNVYFTGWERSSYGDLWPFVTGIHHPHGWTKKVSEGELRMNTNPNFWRVSYFEYPTETGSSGSPVFEEWNDRVIGWLSYSFSDCDNPTGINSYGKLRKAWDGPESAKRLKDWLDPLSYNHIGIDGRDPCFNNVIISNRELRSAQVDYQPRNNVIIQAGNEIRTEGSVTVKSNADFTFKAGTSIELMPGFHAEAGSSFKAVIAPCEQYLYVGVKNLKSAKSIPTKDVNNTIAENKNILEIQDKSQNYLRNIINVYPNPFSTITKLQYYLAEDSFIKIEIYDLYGSKVKELINKYHKKGTYIIEFNGSELNCGMYLCKIISKNYLETIKILKNK